MSALPLDEAYLQWLYRQVADINHKSPSKTYWSLFRQLFTTEFVWLIPNDDNRVEDGRNLRYQFLHQSGIDTVDRNWMEIGCSFLEMLIALSRWCAFEDSGSAESWFWHFLEVLGIDEYTDAEQIPHEDVDDILNRVIFRTYRKDGHGGLFPLRHPRRDQTQVELWYQMNAYLIENDRS